MTVAEKVSQLTNQAAAIPRLDVPAYEWWNEALHGVARAGVATVFPQAIGLAATFDVPLVHEMAAVIGDEGPRQAPPVRAPGQARALPGAHVLVAEHQHLPRPALGPRPGDLRRGPVPHRPARRRVREGAPGRRPALLQGGRDGEALRGTQRPGAGPPPFRRPPERARPLGDVPAGLQGPRGRGEGRGGDGRLQPGERRVGLGEPAPARGHPAARLGLQGTRDVRLRRHRRHPRAPQARGDAGGGRGARHHEGLRSRMRQRLQDARHGARARAAQAERPRRGARAVVHRALQARHVRSAGARSLRADAVLGQRLARARPPRAQGRAGVDRAAQEQRRAAAAKGRRHDRGGGPDGRRPGDAARELPRHADAPGHDPGRDPERGLAEDEGGLRARRRPRGGPAGPARGGGDRLVVPAGGARLVGARPHRPVLPREGLRGRAGADARRPEAGLPLGPQLADRRGRGARGARRLARARRRQLLRALDRGAGAARLGRVRARS